MTEKLTLSIDSKIIEAAKKYSKKKGVSLSKVVENYLKRIGSRSPSKMRKPPLNELRGILGKASDSFDYKTELGKMRQNRFIR